MSNRNDHRRVEMSGDGGAERVDSEYESPELAAGAESGSRTRTSLRTSVFETDASACSATSALPGRATTIPLAGATRLDPGSARGPGRLRADDNAKRCG